MKKSIVLIGVIILIPIWVPTLIITLGVSFGMAAAKGLIEAAAEILD